MSTPDPSLPGIQGYRARRILTMDPRQPVLKDGLLWAGHGSILAVGPYAARKDDFPVPIQDLGEHTMVPGLINAHTHLELAHLHGLTTQGQGFIPWVQSLLRLPMKKVQTDRIQLAIQDMMAQGVAGIGDISGHNPQVMDEIHAELAIPSRLFVEFLGFSAPPSTDIWPTNAHPGHDHLSAAGHALYSTHPETLQAVKSWTLRYQRPFSMHVAEHGGELDLLTTGRGDFADFLRGALLPDSFRPPGLAPVAYADRLGLLDQRTLAVHCVHVDTRDIRILKQRRVHVCLCPRSNAYISCGRPPAEELHAAGVPLCLATDGLSSNHDLNLWHEACYLADIWRGNLSLTELVSLITINPARALGLAQTVGNLQPGKLDRFSLVPEELEDAFPL